MFKKRCSKHIRLLAEIIKNCLPYNKDGELQLSRSKCGQKENHGPKSVVAKSDILYLVH